MSGYLVTIQNKENGSLEISYRANESNGISHYMTRAEVAFNYLELEHILKAIIDPENYLKEPENDKISK